MPGGLAVEGHGVGGQGRADDVVGARKIAADDLVQAVDRIIGHALVAAGLVATGPGLDAVADGIEAVIELLSGHRGAIPEIFVAAESLS